MTGVRKIRPGRRGLRGLVAGEKGVGIGAFESALERDFLILLEFDDAVAAYEVQPLKFPYERAGRVVWGTPDVLIRYRDGDRAQLLTDVKYRAELFSRWPELKPRLRAARGYASAQGWRYEIITEREIRTPRLRNATFLLPYRREPVSNEDREAIARSVATRGPMSLGSLLQRHKSLALQVWCLVARGDLLCDIDKPLSMETLIWI